MVKTFNNKNSMESEFTLARLFNHKKRTFYPGRNIFIGVPEEIYDTTKGHSIGYRDAFEKHFRKFKMSSKFKDVSMCLGYRIISEHVQPFKYCNYCDEDTIGRHHYDVTLTLVSSVIPNFDPNCPVLYENNVKLYMSVDSCTINSYDSNSWSNDFKNEWPSIVTIRAKIHIYEDESGKIIETTSTIYDYCGLNLTWNGTKDLKFFKTKKEVYTFLNNESCIIGRLKSNLNFIGDNIQTILKDIEKTQESVNRGENNDVYIKRIEYDILTKLTNYIKETHKLFVKHKTHKKYTYTIQFNEFINVYNDVIKKFKQLEYDNLKNKKFEFECFDFVPFDESKK